jgi:hypothetical protein
MNLGSLFSGAGAAAKTFLGGFWSKIGLYLGYLAIAFAIVLGCAAIWFYRQNSALNTKVGALKTKVDANYATIGALQTVNDNQDKTIEQLKELRKTDASAVSALISDVKSIHTTNEAVKLKITVLEKRSEEVKHYLNSSIPDALRRADSVRESAAPASASSADH